MIQKIICCTHPLDYKLNHAGSKAVVDVEKFLEEEGYTSISICNVVDKAPKKLKDLIVNRLKIQHKINKGDIVVIQYPASHGKTNTFISDAYAKYLGKKGVNTVAFIHDLECIRVYKGTNQYEQKVREEIEILNKFTYIICHNEKMAEYLIENGVNSKIIKLEVFDYACDDIDENKVFQNNNIIAFAGNLAIDKSAFIYEIEKVIDSDLNINLYGPNYNYKNKQSNNVSYKGIYTPENLVNKLNEKFGLIWDGDSLNTCTGNLGEYTRYNNPHKLSLYIAAGLPVIVWKEAAISKFVEKYNIGITVNNLKEIENILYNLSDEEYKIKKSNLNELRLNVMSGKFTKAAIRKVEEDVLNNK